jgi:hypothetical protein
MAFKGFTYQNIDAKGNPTTVYDEAIVPLGTVATDNDGNQHIFLQGIGSVVAGDWVTYNPSTFVAARLVANAVGPAAVFQAAVVADKFGWACIGGLVVANAISGGAAAAGAALYITATTAVVDDVKVVGDLVVGAFAATAEGTPSAGKLNARLVHPPYVTNVLPGA